MKYQNFNNDIFFLLKYLLQQLLISFFCFIDVSNKKVSTEEIKIFVQLINATIHTNILMPRNE